MNGSLRPSASVPTAFVVDTCSPRQDGDYLLTFLRPPGFAIADRPIPVGTRVTVVNGRAV